jgi:hypothetical protein
MKKISLLLSLLGMVMASATYGQWSIVQTNAVFHNGTSAFTFSGNSNADALPSLTGGHLGRYTSESTLLLVNGLVRSSVGSSGNFCSATLFYRVYNSCSTAPAYSQLSLPSFSASGTSESYQLATNTTISLLNGLTEEGTYIVDIYFSATGSATSASSCSSTLGDGTLGAPRRAYFEFGTADSFTDRNFTADPVWSGNTNQYQIITNSTAGPNTTNSYSLRLNASGDGLHYLSTPYNAWGLTHEWAFWLGRNGTAASNTDQSIVWLFANESDLTNTTTIDGYRLLLGDNTGDDDFFLQRVENGLATTILSGSADVVNGRTDYGVTVRVTKSSTGEWALFTSTPPTTNGGGLSAFACPISNSTVSQGTATDNTIPVNGNGFYGVASRCGNSAANRSSAEYDNFIHRVVVPYTKVSFASATASVQEGLGTFTIPIALSGASALQSTSLQVVLTSGNSSVINNYSTTTITFPAGSNATQNLTITVPENSDCTTHTLTFSIQNLTGGSQAQLGDIQTFTLTVVDNDLLSASLFTDNFEPETSNSWIFSPSNSWSESNFFVISGTGSLRHTAGPSGGVASAVKDVGTVDLNGATTTWRVKMGNDYFEPSASTKFLYYLAASSSNLNGSTVNGYAVGVDQTAGAASSPDLLSLWRVTNGQLIYPAIIQTTFDWDATTLTMSIEVTRSPDGTWSMQATNSNNYNLLAPIGTAGVDNTHTTFQFIGTRYLFTAANSGLYLIDDVELNQETCPTILYSQASGPSTDAIWSYSPVGSAFSATPGKNTTIVVQAGHTVDINTPASINNITIESGATLALNSSTVRLYGNLSALGSIEPGVSTIQLTGSGLQQLSGSDLHLHHLTLDNAGGATLNDSLKLSGSLLALNGIFSTQNKLILSSNASGDGTIGTISSGADVVGQITLNRFIPAGPSYWVYMGSPIMNQTIANWNDEIVTTGFPGSDIPAFSFTSFYSYNEAITGNRNQGWTAPTSVNDPLLPATGYIAFMSAASNTVITSGDFHKGQLTVPLSYNNHNPGVGYNDPDGWNLITNPYPSYIDWELVDANSSASFDGNYYVYHTPSANYRVYNANSSLGTASRYIPHSQGFFVQASDANQTLVFTESVKTTTGASFSRSADDTPLLRLSIEQGGMRDEAVMTFVDGASSNFDSNYDAAKWDSPVTAAPEIAFVTAQQERLSIDARPMLGAEITGVVYVDMPAAGTYTLRFDELKNISLNICITLQDLVTGNMYTVEEGNSFDVVLSQAYTGNRFALRIGTPLSISSTPASCHGEENGTIHLLASEGDGWNWQLFNSLGHLVTNGEGTQWIEQLGSDTYTLTVQSTEPGCEARDLYVEVEQPLSTLVYVEQTAATCNTAENGKIKLTLDNETTFNYTLLTSDAQVIQSGTSYEGEWEANDLSAGTYLLQVQSTCMDTTVSVALSDPQALELDLIFSTQNITLAEGDSTLLTVTAWCPNALNYSWTVNGNSVEGDAELPLMMTASGEYTISVTANNENCTATAQGIVTVQTTVGMNNQKENTEPVLIQVMDSEVLFVFDETLAGNKTIHIYSSTGQLVHTNNSAHGNRYAISTENFAKGVYTYSVYSNDLFIETGKFNF